MTSGKRSSDGITTIKVAISIAAFFIAISVNLIAYFYLADRSDNKQFRDSVAASLQKLVVNYEVSDARTVNLDARVAKQEKKFEQFVTESRVYWRRAK